MKISNSDILKQYRWTKKKGWLPLFEKAASDAGTSTAHFLAIASRETNIKNIRGDFRNRRYNGYGPMQIDVGTDAEFAKNWSEDDAAPGIERGGEIYQSKVKQIENGQGKVLSVRGKKFTGRFTQPDDVRRIATAAYNSGLWAYYHFSNEAHVDSTTTGKDYSRDVYDRALVFAELLEADGEAGAYAREVELQGKYATAQEKSKVKEPVTSKPKEAGGDKGVTTSEKPADETSGTPPPAPAVEVRASEVPFWTRMTSLSIPAGVISAIGGIIAFAKELPPYAWIAFSVIVVSGMVIGYLVWKDGKAEAHERTKIVMQAAADKDRNNLRLI